ncbi:MAG: beta-galactosidase, partial [Acidobacteriaceae bacterium]|nr:beta-galactosidase [Acidobacteriaceae bacterium]
GPDQSLPASIHTVHGSNRFAKQVNYYFNYSAEAVTFPYQGPAGKDLLTDSAILPQQQQTIKPWDLMIVEQP